MRLALLLVVAVLSLAFASPAQAVYPWQPDPDYPNTEGPYVITGSGPPNAQVEVIRDDEIHPSFSNDPVLSYSHEATSPTGQYRVDIGNCTSQGTDDTTPCEAEGGTYRIAFYLGTKVTRWASGSLTRGGATPITVNPYDGQEPPSPRTPTLVVNESTAPLAEYQRIRGFVQGAPASGPAKPLKDVRVEMYDAQGRSYENYNYDQVNVGSTSSVSDGYYSVRVPPGSWKLLYRTNYVQGSYPTRWSGCGVDFASATFLASGTEGNSLLLGEPNGCTPFSGEFPPVTPGGSNPPSSTGPTVSPLPATAAPATNQGGGPTIGKAPALTGVKVVKAGPTVTLDLNVGGPGSVAAKTLTSYAVLASAKKKDVVIAAASKRITKAGKVRLVLKPSAKAKKVIAKKGKLRGRTTITFKPTAGKPTSTTKTVTFKRAKK